MPTKLTQSPQKLTESATIEIETKQPVSSLDKIKDWYYSSLLICFAGIIGLYSGYAYLQESLLADKEKQLNTSFVLGVQQLIAVVTSSLIIKICGMGNLFDEFTKGDLTVGLLNFATQYSSNFALKFVSFPFMALAKSAKILPVILTGWLRGVLDLTRGQVVIGITISSGLVIFSSNKIKNGFDDSAWGIGLVLVSLLFDGFVSSQTDKNHRATKRAFAYHSMLYTNTVCLLGNIFIFVVQALMTGDSTIEKVTSDLSLMRQVILLGLCGAIGQIFIYLTISLFDSYKVAIATTGRKCISVVISNIAFNHTFSTAQWLGASLVLGSTCLEVYLGNKRKQEKEKLSKIEASAKKLN